MSTHGLGPPLRDSRASNKRSPGRKDDTMLLQPHTGRPRPTLIGNGRPLKVPARGKAKHTTSGAAATGTKRRPSTQNQTRQQMAGGEQAQRRREGSSSPRVGFGSQSSRFNTAGTYPRALKPGTCIAATYALKDEDRRRGPGMHTAPLDETAQSAARMTTRSNEPEWSRQASHPHKARLGVSTKHQRLKKQKEREARELGPGTYSSKAFHEDAYGRVPISLGRPGPRMTPEDRNKLRLPDATAYADARDKYEEYAKTRASPCRIGALEGAAKRQTLEHKAGCDIPPNMYAEAHGTTLVKPSITNRGPYDISSGKRFAVRKTDYDLVPGQYGVVNLAPLSSSTRPRTAGFAKVDRFGTRTGMRLESELAGPNEDSLGPGHYTLDLSQSLPLPGEHSRRKAAFGSTGGRRTLFDEVITRGQRTPTDPAEYNPPIIGTEHSARRYRHTYAASLRSTVGRFDSKGGSDKMAERLNVSYR